MKTELNTQPDLIAAVETSPFQADLLQHVPDAVIITDLDFNINSWNNAAETIYGWQAHEVIGKRLGNIVSTTFPHNHQEAVITHLFNVGNWQASHSKAAEWAGNSYFSLSILGQRLKRSFRGGYHNQSAFSQTKH